MDDLLAEIEVFITAKQMTPTAFGREALGDPSFVPDLKDGRRVWPETAEKVRKYIQDKSSSKRAARKSQRTQAAA